MKDRQASSLPSYRNSALARKRSPVPIEISPAASSRPALRTRPALRRPPLKRSSPTDSVDLSSSKAIDQSIAFERELQNLLEVEYRDDVQEYMYEMESRTMASVELIDMQPELQWYMRPYLVDFLIEIHQQHSLRSETLYLAINIVDRYVSKRIVFKKHYQLVGCAALWIAAKFEDAKDRVPTVGELCQACCGAYEESAFVQMEGHVLSTIGWVLGHPTAEGWLRLASIGFGLEEQKVQHASRFLMEITLFHRAFVAFKPSDIAVASLLLGRFMLGKPRRCEYETEDVLRIVKLLDDHLAEHLDQVSAIVIKKYSFAFYSRASTTAREWYLSGNRFSLPICATPSSSCSSLSSASRGDSIFTTGTSSPLTSPSSEASFCTSDRSSDFEDDRGPLTPLTPISSCSLVDHMDSSHSASKLSDEEHTLIQHSDWDSENVEMVSG